MPQAGENNMGYFSNGSEGLAYEAAYCDKCIHQFDQTGKVCKIWELHMLKNYDECNNKESILHDLIPRSELGNATCTMFIKTLGKDQMEHGAVTRINMLENLVLQQERQIKENTKCQN